MPGILERQSPDFLESILPNKTWVVRVYNNDHNTWEEVITILVMATGCTIQEASMETWEIDRLGSSVVHHGDEPECRKAAKVISSIGIRVEVAQE